VELTGRDLADALSDLRPVVLTPIRGRRDEAFLGLLKTDTLLVQFKPGALRQQAEWLWRVEGISGMRRGLFGPGASLCPTFTTLGLHANGGFSLVYRPCHLVPETRVKTVREVHRQVIDGREIPETLMKEYCYTVFKPILETRTLSAAAEEIKVFCGGRELTGPERAAALSEPKPVVLEDERQLLDRAYLDLLKPDTLVVRVGRATQQRAPAPRLSPPAAPSARPSLPVPGFPGQ
jgi:hypothetical protein